MSEPWSSVLLGVLAGGAWNLASLWCLRQLVRAWLGPQPSRPRVIGWLLVKFPFLYYLIFLMLRSGVVSSVGFGIGFSVVLAAAMGGLLWRAQRTVAHGR